MSFYMTDQTNSVTVKFRLTTSYVFLALARHTVRRMWFSLLVPIVGTITIVWAIIDPLNAPGNLSGGCELLVLGVFSFCGLPYLQTREVMKTPNLGGLITFTVSEQGIEFTGEHSNARIAWTMVKGVSETNDAILIHLKPFFFRIVPKGQLSQAAVAAFKNVLQLHVHGKVKLAKV
jgi:YcxB-like protein